MNAPGQPGAQGAPQPNPGGAPAAPPDPLVENAKQVADLLATPTWDDAINLMRQDGPRGFRVDIETDSTISGDLQSDQEGMQQLLTGLTAFWNAIGPAVESGMVPVEAVKSITLSAVRRAKLGRVVEDAIDKIGEDQPKSQGPNLKLLEAQYKMANLQFQQEQLAADTQTKMRQMALDERSMALKEAAEEQRSAAENTKTVLEHQRETQKNDIAAATAVSEHLRGLLDHVARMHQEAIQGGGPRRVRRVHNPQTGETHYMIEPAPQTVQ